MSAFRKMLLDFCFFCKLVCYSTFNRYFIGLMKKIPPMCAYAGAITLYGIKNGIEVVVQFSHFCVL